jgi:hypothetical protein
MESSSRYESLCLGSYVPNPHKSTISDSLEVACFQSDVLKAALIISSNHNLLQEVFFVADIISSWINNEGNYKLAVNQQPKDGR